MRIPKYLPPTAKSRGRFYKREQNKQFLCFYCKNSLERLTETNLENLLNHSQKVAQQIGSVRYQGFRCLQCAPESFHLRRYVINRRYHLCPQCDEYTLESNTWVVEQATTESTGLERTTKNCHACNYYLEKDRIIPMITSSSSDSSSNDSFSSDFGGGDSGGGGAGADW